MSPVELLPCALPEMFAQISTSGKITLADRYGLMAAILKDGIEEEEIRSIDRLLYSVARGRVQVVNELSSLV